MMWVLAVFSLGNVLSAAEITVDPTSHDFGNVIVGNSVAEIFTLSNSRDTSSHLGNLGTVEIVEDELGNVTTLPSTEFIVSNDNCSGIEFSPSMECTFATEFQPLSNEQKTATLLIPYSDEFGNPSTPLTVPLKGLGISFFPPLSPQIKVEPLTHNFEEVSIGSTSGYQPFFIKNSGAADLKLGQMTLEDDEFVVAFDNCSNQTVVPNQICVGAVEFAPLSEGTKTATLSILSDDPDTPTVQVKLEGLGILPPPRIEVEPTAHDFGPIEVGEEVELEMTISSMTVEPLQLETLTLSNTVDFELAQGSNCFDPISPEAPCKVTVVFKPQSMAAKDAILSISSNDPDRPKVQVELYGNQPTPRCRKKPTVVSVRPGNWGNPNTWEPHVPTRDDIVLIKKDHVIEVPYPYKGDGFPEVVKVKGLCNHGTLLSEPNNPLHIESPHHDGFIDNYGTIAGRSGINFTNDEDGSQGSSVVLRIGIREHLFYPILDQTDSIRNRRSGLSNLKALKSDETDGYTVELIWKTGTLINWGTIKAGDGKEGGNGGDLNIVVEKLYNYNEIQSGKGGNGTEEGGNGGDMSINSDELNNDGAIQTGKGGSGSHGKGGNGGEVKILAGKVATKGTVLSGEGGSGTSPGTEGTVDIPDQEEPRTRSASVLGPGQLIGEPGSQLSFNFTLSNDGPMVDVYDLIVKDSAGWQVETLPPTIFLGKNQIIDFEVEVILPQTPYAKNTITIKAVSQTEPSEITTTEVTITALAACPSGTIAIRCNNKEGVIENVIIEPNAYVIGGTIGGTIKNNGTVSHVKVEAGTQLTGGKLDGDIFNEGIIADFEFVGTSVTGGTLSGTIKNHNGGVFVNVHLAENASINGGAVQGDIGGDSEARALLTNVRINPDSHLTHLVLGDNVQWPEDPKEVMLGEGTRFSRYADIPTGIELIGVLPDLLVDDVEGVTYPKRADLSADVLEQSDGILSAINELANFKNNDWSLRQDTELGHIELDIENLRFAVLPVSVKKTTDPAGLNVQDDQCVRFIADTGLEVLAQPTLQAPSALLSALTEVSDIDVSELTVQTNGNLQIPASEDIWFSARPAWLSTEIEEMASDTKMGLEIQESPYVSGLGLVSLVFADRDGQRREQIIPPAIAQPATLNEWIEEEVSVKVHGWISFKLDGKTYRGVMDYVVTQGTETARDTLQVKSIPDANDDGIADVKLIYPDGEEQIMFLVE
jgi:hypothetical protein